MAQPEFPNYNEKVAQSLEGLVDAGGGLPGFLGMRHVEVGPGLLRAEVDARADLATPFGNLHGGVIAALCDHVLGTVCYPVIPRGAWAATTEFKLNYLAPVTTGVLDRNRPHRLVDAAHRGRAYRRRERRSARVHRPGDRARDGTERSVRREHGVRRWRLAFARHRRGATPRMSAKPATCRDNSSNGKATRREQIQRRSIRRRVDTERAEHPELLVHDEVGVEAGCVGSCRVSRPERSSHRVRASRTA